MENYDKKTILAIPGNTPREKHDNLMEILRILNSIAYPRRGTWEDGASVEVFADLISKVVPYDAQS